MSAGFVWRDADRTVVCRAGALAAAPELLAEHGFAEFELVATERSLAEAPQLAAAATSVHEVASGQVPPLAAALLERVGTGPLVALGGGRPIDVAKAVASVTGAPVAALPTTLSGAEMTAIHRLPGGAEQRVRGHVRPRLVLADPVAMTGLPERALRASALNALAHGADSLPLPLANPVSRMLALQGAELIATALDADRTTRNPEDLAFGSLLCAYAADSVGLGLHHVICQTLVRTCGTPHAETNAAIFPQALTFLTPRAPETFTPLATALGTDPQNLAPRVSALGNNPTGLTALGLDKSNLDQALDTMLARPELAQTPGPPITRSDLAQIITNAS